MKQGWPRAGDGVQLGYGHMGLQSTVIPDGKLKNT